MKTACRKEIMKEYLRDESKQTGISDRILFPETEEDIMRIFKAYPDTPITLQGARTGVTAGCVPNGGIAVNMERMNRILDLTYNEDGGTVTVQPGVLLQSLRRHIAPLGLFFPPDPTETTASLGGMASCNSSGARSFRYGAVRGHILALDIVLVGGTKLHLVRGRKHAEGNQFQLVTTCGRLLKGTLPSIRMPEAKKHTAGYCLRPDMDLIDLFIGSEGTLGVLTSIKLKLIPQKQYTWGGVLFLPDEASALKLVRMLRGEMGNILCLRPEALEFFGADTLTLLRQAQREKTVLTQMEQIREDACCAVYAEYASDNRALMEQAFEQTCQAMEAAGADPYRTWAAINHYHMEKLHLFRHAAPECVNMKIAQIKKTCPAVTKLGTDMSVPDRYLGEVFSMYREGLAEEKLESAIFGHIGDNHLHVNVIPESMDEFYRTKELFARWAQQIVSYGGSVCAEHGVGKLKTGLLKHLYSEEQLDSMRALKKVFDPKEILNRGTIFTDVSQQQQ